MAQRLMIGSTVLSMIVSVTLVAMVGRMIHEQQQTNTALVSQLALLAQRTNDPSSGANSHSTHLQLKVLLGDESGRAAEGYVVFVSKQQGIGEAINPNRVMVKRDIGPSGLADCGYVEPAEYQVQIQSPWGEFATAALLIPPGTSPGKDHVEQIIVPETPPQNVPVSLNLDEWPKEFARNGFLIKLEFHGKKPRQFAGQSWRQVMTSDFFLLPAEGRIWTSEMPHRQAAGLGGLVMEMAKQFSGELNPGLIVSGQVDESSEADHVKNAKWEPADRWGVPAGDYHIQMTIWALTEALSPDDERWRDVKIETRTMYSVKEMTLLVSAQSDKNVLKIVPAEGDVDDLRSEAKKFIKTRAGRPSDNAPDYYPANLPEDGVQSIGDPAPDAEDMRSRNVPQPIDGEDDQPIPAPRNRPEPKPDFRKPQEPVPRS